MLYAINATVRDGDSICENAGPRYQFIAIARDNLGLARRRLLSAA